MGQIGFQALEIGEQGQVWLSGISEGCCFNLCVNCDQVIKPESGGGGRERGESGSAGQKALFQGVQTLVQTLGLRNEARSEPPPPRTQQ